MAILAKRQEYHKISNIRRTKSPNLNVSRLILQLSLPNTMKPGVKSRMKMSWLGRVTRDENQVLGSTSIPARLDTLVFWESFSWLTSAGTTRNTVNRLGWSRIGLAVLILNAAGAGLIGRPAVISGRYNKCHSLQLQNHYAHFPPLQHTHIHARHSYAELVVGNDHGFRGIVCWPWQEESCVIG